MDVGTQRALLAVGYVAGGLIVTAVSYHLLKRYLDAGSELTQPKGTQPPKHPMLAGIKAYPQEVWDNIRYGKSHRPTSSDSSAQTKDTCDLK